MPKEEKISLEAEVTVYADGGLLKELEQLGDELRFVFITSEASARPLGITMCWINSPEACAWSPIRASSAS